MKTRPALTERMSVADVVRFRMDEPTNPMVVTAALLLDGALSPDELARIVERRLLAHARFRQRVVDGLWPRWAVDPSLDVREHVEHLAVEEGGDAALAEIVGRFASEPLPRGRALWRFALVDGVPGRSVVLARVHHAIADGHGLVRVLRDLTRPLDDGPPAGRARSGDEARRERRSPLAAARELGRSLFASAEPDTPLRAAVGPRKAYAWTGAFPLDAVKRAAVKRGAPAGGGHASEVLLAAIAGALRTRLREHGVPEPLPELHALVPVAAAPRRGARDLGNHYASVLVALPVAREGSAARLAAMHERLARARAGARASRLALGALGTMGLASAGLEHLAVRLLSQRATLTFSSVPGPAGAVALGGCPVRDAIVWAPTSGGIGLSLTAFGYAGRIRVGVAADAHLAGEARALAAAVDRELAELAHVAGASTMEPRCPGPCSPSPNG